MNLLKLPPSASLLRKWILKGFIDATALRTNRILELGCGNIQNGWSFLPNVSRDLAESGYDITWIDILDNTYENFNGIRIDLSDPDNLRVLPEEEFYVAFDNNFTWDNRCPVLSNKVQQNWMSWWEYLWKLDRAICSTLINWWIYIRWGFYTDFFQKIQWELVKINEYKWKP